MSNKTIKAFLYGNLIMFLFFMILILSGVFIPWWAKDEINVQISKDIFNEYNLTEHQKTSEKTPKELPTTQNLGRFKLTAYCPCMKCCGKTNGITATGVKAKANRTVAVDPKKIPYGTVLKINGKTYVAEDCGGAIKGNRVDIFFDTHAEALKFGVKYADIIAEV